MFLKESFRLVVYQPDHLNGNVSWKPAHCHRLQVLGISIQARAAEDVVKVLKSENILFYSLRRYYITLKAGLDVSQSIRAYLCFSMFSCNLLIRPVWRYFTSLSVERLH